MERAYAPGPSYQGKAPEDIGHVAWVAPGYALQRESPQNIHNWVCCGLFYVYTCDASRLTAEDKNNKNAIPANEEPRHLARGGFINFKQITIMKKSIFAKLMMLVMMTVVTMTFTACGGDSGDEGTPQKPTGQTGSTGYVDPCLDFGSSVAHVKEYMNGSYWTLDNNSSESVLLYSNSNATVVLNYMFVNAKLRMVTATYSGGGEGRALSFKSEIEKRYGVTMTDESNPADDSLVIYRCTATVNQRDITIVISCYEQVLNILYRLAD